MQHKTTKPAIFLDRDGTLNVDKGYVHKIEDWEWLPNVPETLAAFKRAGYALIVVTNQSGVARGFYDENAITTLHNWVNEQLKSFDCELIFYHCPHLPEISGPCACRKPSPQMLLQAAAEHNIDLTNSWMIGDRLRDIEAGKAAGCKTLLVTTGEGQKEIDAGYTGQFAANLTEAFKIIVC